MSDAIPYGSLTTVEAGELYGLGGDLTDAQIAGINRAVAQDNAAWFGNIQPIDLLSNFQTTWGEPVSVDDGADYLLTQSDGGGGFPVWLLLLGGAAAVLVAVGVFGSK